MFKLTGWSSHCERIRRAADHRHVEKYKGRKLTEREVNLTLEQARAIGKLSNLMPPRE